MDKMVNDTMDFEFTIAPDASDTGSKTQASTKTGAVIADNAVKNLRSIAEDPRVTMDRLYDAYEKMFLQEPTVLDVDDIYPHSYQWRSVDRYNLAKLAVLTEAVKNGRRIADTEAYHSFVEAAKNRRIRNMSWDV